MGHPDAQVRWRFTECEIQRAYVCGGYRIR